MSQHPARTCRNFKHFGSLTTDTEQNVREGRPFTQQRSQVAVGSMHPSCPAISDCCDWQPFLPCRLPKLGLTPAVCACRCVNVLSINIWGEFDYPGRQLFCRSCMQTRISFVLATLEHAHQDSQACPDCLLAALKDVTTKARVFKSCRSCSHCHKFVTEASGRSYSYIWASPPGASVLPAPVSAAYLSALGHLD